MNLLKRVKAIVSKISKVPPGLYTYRGRGEFTRLALQLRVEPDGRGLLVINANTVLYLNETATAHTYFFMQGMPTGEVVKKVRHIYRVGKEEARRDHEHILYTVSTLAQTEEVCPISFLDVEKVEPFSRELSAPIRMDLALTFRCQNNCLHCYTGGPHETPELNTDQWKKVIGKLHKVGIFLITFTGGEPTLREDLPELLRYAQEMGMVTGLITNGRRLKDGDYVQKLVSTGLDFVQITLESHDPAVHDRITGVKGSWQETVEGIKKVVPTPIYVTTNTTLNRYNAEGFLETLNFLRDLGLGAFGCNSLIYSGKAPSVAEEFALDLDALRKLLPSIQAKASQLGMKFLWYTPTQYCELDPVSLGLGVKSCSAARVNMCVGPNGEVYPCQSYFKSVGNILKDKWDKIWNNPLCVGIRKREYAPEKCEECPQLPVCGGGCPLELLETPYLCAEVP